MRPDWSCSHQSAVATIGREGRCDTEPAVHGLLSSSPEPNIAIGSTAPCPCAKGCGDSHTVVDVIQAADGSFDFDRRPMGEDGAALPG